MRKEIEEMEGIHRKILCMGVVTALLLSLLGTGVVADDIAEEEPLDGTMEVLITVVYRGQGFVLEMDGDKFYTLRIHIVRVRQIDPTVIRELMEEGKSIEEIKDELVEMGQAPFYQGDMLFAEEEHYRLGNISVTKDEDGDGDGDNLTINAEVMVPLQDSEPGESVGNISVTVIDYEDVRITRGELTMHEEKYWVLLDVLPPLPGKENE